MFSPICGHITHLCICHFDYQVKPWHLFFFACFKFYFMCMGILHVCLCSTCAQSTQRPEEGIRTSGTGATDSCESLDGCWELKLSLWKSSQCRRGRHPLQPPSVRRFIMPWLLVLSAVTPRCLHTWSPAGGALWEGCGTFSSWTLT